MTLNFWDSETPNSLLTSPLTTREERLSNRSGPAFRTNTVTEIDVGLGDTISAQLGYSYMPIINAFQNLSFDEDVRDPQYDPFKDMQGYEAYADYLKDAVNSEHMLQLKQQLEANHERRRILENSSFGSQIIAGIFDPINLIPLPFGGFAKGIIQGSLRTGLGVAGITAVAEAARYPFDPLATPAEVGANIGMSFVGGTLLGGIISGVTRLKVGKVIDELENDVDFHNNMASDTPTESVVTNKPIKSSGTTDTFKYNEETVKIEELIKKGSPEQLEGHKKFLETKLVKLEESIKSISEDPRLFTSIEEAKKIRKQRKELQTKITNERKKVDVFVKANQELQKNIQDITTVINKIGLARDRYANSLLDIKKKLIDQSEGKTRSIGLTDKQLKFLNEIKSKEANKFFSAKQRTAINKLLNKIKSIQNQINKNKRLLKTKQEGNEVFLGRQRVKEIQNNIDELDDIIQKNNQFEALRNQFSTEKNDFAKLTNELKIREINESAIKDAEGNVIEDALNLHSDNWFGKIYMETLYKAVPTPLKSAIQSKILPNLSKLKFLRLAGDNANNLVAHKHNVTLGSSVNTKAVRRNGEYVKAHDKLRQLYAEHTGKNQVYLDYDFQKRGYGQWLEDTYTKILKQEPLSDLDKKVKSVVDNFMKTWEQRLRKQGIIGDIPNLTKQVFQLELRLINQARNLKDIVSRGGDQFQINNAKIIEKDMEAIFRGVRKQTRYKNIKELSVDEIQERFGQDYNIKRIIDDPELFAKAVEEEPRFENVLGVHVRYNEGKGEIFINEAAVKERWRVITKAQKEEYKESFFQKFFAKYVPDNQVAISRMHLKFEYDNYKYFDNYNDFYDFILFHELTHGKYKQFKNESTYDFELRTNELALERLLIEKETFNPQTQGLVLSKKTMNDLDTLKNLKATKENRLTQRQIEYKNRIIDKIKRGNQELIELRKSIKDAQENVIKTSDVEDFFPRYWDVDAIKNNRAGFANVLRDWFINNPTVWVRQPNGTLEKVPALTHADKMKATSEGNLNARIENTINNIIKGKQDITSDEMAFFGHGKSKHLRHRTLDIPNSLVTDFIIKNPVQVMQVYTKKLAPKYEFSVAYNGKNIDQVIDDMTIDNYNAGMSIKEIDAVNKNFLHLYDRVVGNVLKNPNRWDQTVVTVLRDLAQLNYLGSSGFSTLPDLAKILMEHELGNVMKGLTGIIQDSRVRLTAKEGRLAGEILEILQGDVHMRNVEDLTNSPIAQGYQKKMSTVRNVFFALNGLAPMTNLMKKLDGVIRQHEMIDFALKEMNGTAKANDITYLRRYGITKKISKDIKDLVDKGVIQNTKDGKGVWLGNTEKWLENGIAEESLDAFRDSLNNGIMNTILMATPADKPIIADGVVYIPKWIGEKFGLKEDVRFKGYTRIETGIAGLPFQFWSYSFAAANKITFAMATGQAKNRAAAFTAAVGLGYLSLEIKSRFSGPAIEAMFDNMSWEDKLARSIDSSGILAMYSDLFYTAMDTSLALGGPDISMGLLQPKVPRNYEDLNAFERAEEVVGAVGGAGPSIGIDLFNGASEFVMGEYGEGSKNIIKNLPYMRLWFIKEQVYELGSILTDIEDDGFERTLRSRF